MTLDFCETHSDCGQLILAEQDDFGKLTHIPAQNRWCKIGLVLNRGGQRNLKEHQWLVALNDFHIGDIEDRIRY
jgi:hypothetical protein